MGFGVVLGLGGGKYFVVGFGGMYVTGGGVGVGYEYPCPCLGVTCNDADGADVSNELKALRCSCVSKIFFFVFVFIKKAFCMSNYV